MANPKTIEVTADTWNLVAENVTAGQVHRADKRPGIYLQTYRMTGDDPPTEQREGVPAFLNGAEIIDAAAAIDVYIFPVGSNGWVRVDIP